MRLNATKRKRFLQLSVLVVAQLIVICLVDELSSMKSIISYCE